MLLLQYTASSLLNAGIFIFTIYKFFESLGNSLSFWGEISLENVKSIHCGDRGIRNDVQESENKRSNHQGIIGI